MKKSPVYPPKMKGHMRSFSSVPSGFSSFFFAFVGYKERDTEAKYETKIQEVKQKANRILITQTEIINKHVKVEKVERICIFRQQNVIVLSSTMLLPYSAKTSI